MCTASLAYAGFSRMMQPGQTLAILAATTRACASPCCCVTMPTRWQVDDESFFTFLENDIGKFYFYRFVQDVHPPHGNFLLQIGRYKFSVHEKRSIAEELIAQYKNVITEIFSGEDEDTLLEAYEQGKKPVGKPGKKSRRQNQKNQKLKEADTIVADAERGLARTTGPDLLNDMCAPHAASRLPAASLGSPASHAAAHSHN
jgi:hypothetical protein